MQRTDFLLTVSARSRKIHHTQGYLNSVDITLMLTRTPRQAIYPHNTILPKIGPLRNLSYTISCKMAPPTALLRLSRCLQLLHSCSCDWLKCDNFDGSFQLRGSLTLRQPATLLRKFGLNMAASYEFAWLQALFKGPL